MSFVVDPSSLSESAIYNDLVDFVNTRPDAASWQNFFESSVGVTVLKLMSGLSAYYTYNNIVGRREAFVQYAQNLSSVIGGAQYLGYSAFRGSNPIVTLTITPNFTGTINRFTVVGVVKSRELVALEDVVVNNGETATVQCVIGDLKEDTLLAASSNPALFRFSGSGLVSDTLRVLVDGDEVERSEKILDVTKLKFVSQTNAVGSVDLFSENSINAPIRYDTNSEIKIEWIELKQLDYIDSDIQFDFGDITSIQTDAVYQDPETLEQIRLNARIQNEVQFTIRAREDQPKQFQTLDPSILDASGEDVSAAVMRLYYLLEDDLLFSSDEKEDLVSQFEQFRPHGMLPPLIGDPTRVPIVIKVDAVLENTSGDPENDIKAITQAYARQLGGSINLEDLEKEIEALANIKIARPSFSGDRWYDSTKYELLQHVTSFPDNGRVYQALLILYFSDSVEPVWPIIEAGEVITDKDIIWRSIPKDDTAGVADWAADTSYTVGNLVKPTVANGYIYEAIETLNTSDSVEPVWTPMAGQNPVQYQGTKILDGDIMWIARPTEGTPTIWTADTVYRKGDSVIATDPSGSDVEGVMFQAFAYLGTSDGVQPSWSTVLDATVIDNNIVWICQDPLQKELELSKGEYFTITEDITVS